jgi:hypothetical protein
MRGLLPWSLFALAGPVDAFAATPSGFLALRAPLDQPAGERYCADVIGMVVDADLRIQAHTCKAPSNDQLFSTDVPRLGKIYVTDHDLCIEATASDVGATMFTAECGATPTQRWTSSAGQIHPADDATLCWTVDARPVGEPAGGGNLKRDLTLQPCADFDAEYNTWNVPGAPIGR